MLVKLALGFLVVVVGLLAACTILVLRAGVGSIFVDNDDVTLWLPLPMALTELSIGFIPEEELQKVRRGLKPVEELVLVGCDAVQDCPDATFVEIRTARESVQVLKRGSDLVIDVDSSTDGKVHVEVPLRSLERIVRSLIGQEKTATDVGSKGSRRQPGDAFRIPRNQAAGPQVTTFERIALAAIFRPRVGLNSVFTLMAHS